jgi:hypothetical protein
MPPHQPRKNRQAARAREWLYYVERRAVQAYDYALIDFSLVPLPSVCDPAVLCVFALRIFPSRRIPRKDAKDRKARKKEKRQSARTAKSIALSRLGDALVRFSEAPRRHCDK